MRDRGAILGNAGLKQRICWLCVVLFYNSYRRLCRWISAGLLTPFDRHLEESGASIFPYATAAAAPAVEGAFELPLVD